MNVLFDTIKQRHKLTTDTQLANLLLLSCSTICNLRSGEQPSMSAHVLIRIYDRAKMSIEEIRKLAKEG